jgi:hypothetical protein
MQKGFIIYLLLNAHKKMKKSTIIQDPMFSNPTFLHNTSHRFGFWLSTFLGLELGLEMVKLWSSMVAIGH